MTTKHEVIAVHHANPNWTSGMIALHLGCSGGYVCATFRRNGLKLPFSGKRTIVRTTERERCARIAEVMGSPEIAAEIRGGKVAG